MKYLCYVYTLFSCDPTDLGFHTDGHGHNVLGELKPAKSSLIV